MNFRSVIVLVALLALAAVGVQPNLRAQAATFDPTVVWAVGDLCAYDPATARCGEVGSLIAGDPQADGLLALGDLQYPDGDLALFESVYDTKMGRGPGLYDKSFPSPGNHEYMTPAAFGYYTYWGARAGDASRGYYARIIGPWKVIAVNSNCTQVGGCGAASTQGSWLREQLRNAPKCALVFDHHPAFSDGHAYPGTAVGRRLFNIAQRNGADLFLSGHDHNYQRFRPRNASGAIDRTRGVRQFVVGTGGVSLSDVWEGSTSVVRRADSFGALRLELSPGSYTFAFTGLDGTTLDPASGTPALRYCH